MGKYFGSFLLIFEIKVISFSNLGEVGLNSFQNMTVQGHLFFKPSIFINPRTPFG